MHFAAHYCIVCFAHSLARCQQDTKNGWASRCCCCYCWCEQARRIATKPQFFSSCFFFFFAETNALHTHSKHHAKRCLRIVLLALLQFFSSLVLQFAETRFFSFENLQWTVDTQQLNDEMRSIADNNERWQWTDRRYHSLMEELASRVLCNTTNNLSAVVDSFWPFDIYSYEPYIHVGDTVCILYIV